MRRADIECFGRGLEAKGKARATVARRLTTIVGWSVARPLDRAFARPLTDQVLETIVP